MLRYIFYVLFFLLFVGLGITSLMLRQWVNLLVCFFFARDAAGWMRTAYYRWMEEQDR